jgi:histidine triad (HIT) family protein
VAACPFCAIVRGEGPASVVHQDAHCIAILDIHPVRPGHVLVLPRRHAVFLHELTAAERSGLMETAARISLAQAAIGLPADGRTVLVNDGPAAGQHVPHVHLHVIPRARGDLLAVARAYLLRALGRFGRAANRDGLDALAARLRAHL